MNLTQKNCTTIYALNGAEVMFQHSCIFFSVVCKRVFFWILFQLIAHFCARAHTQNRNSLNLILKNNTQLWKMKIFVNWTMSYSKPSNHAVCSALSVVVVQCSHVHYHSAILNAVHTHQNTQTHTHRHFGGDSVISVKNLEENGSEMTARIVKSYKRNRKVSGMEQC